MWMEGIRFCWKFLAKEKFCWDVTFCAFRFFGINSLLLGMTLHYPFQFFGIVPSCPLHYKTFLLYGPDQYIQWECVSLCIRSGMHNILFSTLLRASRNVLALYALCEVWTISLPLFYFFYSFVFHSPNSGLISSNPLVGWLVVLF